MFRENFGVVVIHAVNTLTCLESAFSLWHLQSLQEYATLFHPIFVGREAALRLLAKLAFLEAITVVVEIKHHSCKHCLMSHKIQTLVSWENFCFSIPE